MAAALDGVSSVKYTEHAGNRQHYGGSYQGARLWTLHKRQFILKSAKKVKWAHTKHGGRYSLQFQFIKQQKIFWSYFFWGEGLLVF